jgi:NAD(P)-dependent dehydrogenase (short-subunit alcohol dehydrogenase family)
LAAWARLPEVDLSHVVTGGGRGIGRAIAERLLAGGAAVVVLDRDDAALGWTSAHPAGRRVIALAGNAADEAVTERAADLAQDAGRLAGWVNNAAVFGDAWLDAVPAQEITNLITANLGLAVTGCATAIRRFLAAGAGAIVNVSSHQARRPVRGALPYATAKAAIEGLTRALAVDYGPRGIRVNAVALGSIATERYRAFLSGQRPEAAAQTKDQMRTLHPLGRVGLPEEVAAAVGYLLSPDASFINGAVLPIDGGRSVLGLDPEQA